MTRREERQDLLEALSQIQNHPFYANVDIMTFAGMCTNEEVREHIERSMLGIQRFNKAA